MNLMTFEEIAKNIPPANIWQSEMTEEAITLLTFQIMSHPV